MSSDVIQWIALSLNAIGLAGAMIYNAGKGQSISRAVQEGMTELKDSLIRMEDRAERKEELEQKVLQGMVDKLYDLGGRVSKLEGMNHRTK